MHHLTKMHILTKIVPARRPRTRLIPIESNEPTACYSDYDMFTKPTWDNMRYLADVLRVAVVDRLSGKIIPAIRTDRTMRRHLGVWLPYDSSLAVDAPQCASDIAASVLEWGEAYRCDRIGLVSIDGCLVIDPNTFEPMLSLYVDFHAWNERVDDAVVIYRLLMGQRG